MKKILCALALLWFVGPLSADIYRWTDVQGRMHISMDPPPEGTKAQVTPSANAAAPVKKNLSKLHDAGTQVGPAYTPPAPVKAPAAAPAPAVVSAPPQVEIYLTTWCGWCKKTKAYFDNKGVAYTAYDVEADAGASQRHRAYNPKGGVPVTVVNGTAIAGYNEAAFAKALGR